MIIHHPKWNVGMLEQWNTGFTHFDFWVGKMLER
jgi:hypothetical protein